MNLINKVVIMYITLGFHNIISMDSNLGKTNNQSNLENSFVNGTLQK
jgi:hypothetical protein